MTVVSRAIGLLPVLLAAVLPSWGCGSADPPLDQLELRDALLSDPVVIAGLPQEAQQRLAGRFWAAVALPESAQTLPKTDANTPEQRLRRLDAQRQQRGQDAFLVGVWGSDAAVETISPFERPVRSSPSVPLPPLPAARSMSWSNAIRGASAPASKRLLKPLHWRARLRPRRD